MFQKNNPPKGSQAQVRKNPPSVIAADVNLLGNMISEGALDIDGRIEGNIQARQVTIRKNGAVIGDVIADSVQIYGRVKGLIRAGEVELYAACHVEGVIMHASLSIEDGAFVDGQLKRTEKPASNVIDATEMDILANLKLIS